MAHEKGNKEKETDSLFGDEGDVEENFVSDDDYEEEQGNDGNDNDGTSSLASSSFTGSHQWPQSFR